MHRIDENTYIDDTLVTCAEYQLFIDELREHRKYFQPDHWKSQQFPPGYGQRPVTGVRAKTAYSFCEWLTHRDNGDLKYRLPTPDEAARYPLKPVIYHPVGYWVMRLDRTFDFMWIGHIPVDARLLLRKGALAPAINRAPSLAELLGIAVDRAANRTIDPDHTDLGIKIDSARKNGYGIIHIIKQARATTLSLVLARMKEENESKEELDRLLDHYVDLVTLQERIAGRSPAFEGIRLVKERIR